MIRNSVEILVGYVHEHDTHFRFIARERFGGVATLRHAIRHEIRLLASELPREGIEVARALDRHEEGFIRGEPCGDQGCYLRAQMLFQLRYVDRVDCLPADVAAPSVDLLLERYRVKLAVHFVTQSNLPSKTAQALKGAIGGSWNSSARMSSRCCSTRSIA